MSKDEVSCRVVQNLVGRAVLSPVTATVTAGAKEVSSRGMLQIHHVSCLRLADDDLM